MSWLFSQALVEAYLPDICSDGEPSAQSNGSLTQLAYLPPDRMTAFSRLSRFGMTFRPLTADRGEELLTLYRAAFPVKTSPQPDAEQALTASDQECGERWPGWLAKFDPSTSSLKTPQCLLFGGGCESLKTLPRSGTTVAGTLWERQTLVHRISGTDFGLSVPTPTVYDSTGNGKPRKDSNGAEGGRHGVSLHHFITMWPTPTVCGNYNRKGASATSGDGLATAVQKWPTPTARIWKGGGEDDSGRWQESGGYAGLAGRTEWWSLEPDVGRVAYGVAARVDRLKALGNGQVPAVAAAIFRILQ